MPPGRWPRRAVVAALAAALATTLLTTAPSPAADGADSFHVVVRFVGGAPPGGARLYIADAPAPGSRELPLAGPVATDPDGLVDLEPLLGPHREGGTAFLTLVVAADGFEVRAVPLTVTAGGPFVARGSAMPLEMRRSVSRTVLVRHGAGTPVAGATVVADRCHAVLAGTPAMLLPVAASTGVDGRAFLSGLPPGDLRLALSLPSGTTFAPCPGLPSADGTTVLTLPPRGDLRCLVRDGDGNPLADAAVSLRATAVGTPRDGPLEAVVEGRTGADGVFRPPYLPRGRVVVSRASVPRLLPAPAPGEPWPEVDATGEGETDLVVTLRAGAPFGGTVVDDLGAPVAGATLRVRAADRSWYQTYLPPATTDGKGEFRFPAVPPGDLLLRVDGPGVLVPVKPGSGPVSVPPGGRVDHVVRTVRTGTVEGVLRRADGSPAAGVPLTVDEPSTGVQSRTRSGPDGRFRFRDVPPGPRLVVVAHPRDRAPVTGKFLALSPGGTVEGVELSMAAGWGVRGRLRRADGGDPTGVMVLLARGAAPEGGTVLADGNWRSARPTADGAFSFGDLDPGPWTVVAGTTRPWMRVLATLTVTDGDVGGLDLVLPVERRLRGSLRTAEGAPVADAAVQAVALTPAGRVAPGTGVVDLATDGEGHFAVVGVPAVPVMLRLFPGTPSEETVRWPAAAAEAVLVLGLGTGLQGRVLDDATGEPVPGARVTAMGAAGEVAPRLDTMTGADGRFSLSTRLRGLERLVVDGPDGRFRRLRLPLPAGDEPLRLRLDRGTALVGRLVDGEGHPLAVRPAPVVEALDPAADAGEPPLRAVRAAPDGSFSIPGLDPGPCTLRVRSPEGDRGPFPTMEVVVPVDGTPVTVVVKME